MRDSYGRDIDYMRISFTDRCNLRCKYCMPDGIRLLPADELLTVEEIVLVCEEAVQTGIQKFKVTGGEPLVRGGCVELVRKLRQIPGVEQVTMTTNGILLKENMDGLLNAGLDAVNISLDTMRPDRFAQITGADQLDTVLEAIDAAIESGLKVKANALLQKGLNEEEWKSLTELTRTKRMDVRFIEMMPIGYGKQCVTVSNEELLATLRAEYPGIQRDGRVHGNGPAVYYHIPGYQGSIGLISAIHGMFCESCNRIRMTSTGDIKPCLCYGESLSLRDAARSGNRRRTRQLLEQAVMMKPEQHCFNTEEKISEKKAMAAIGG